MHTKQTVVQKHAVQKLYCHAPPKHISTDHTQLHETFQMALIVPLQTIHSSTRRFKWHSTFLYRPYTAPRDVSNDTQRSSTDHTQLHETFQMALNVPLQTIHSSTRRFKWHSTFLYRPYKAPRDVSNGTQRSNGCDSKNQFAVESQEA
jgi:hypothetical protein